MWRWIVGNVFPFKVSIGCDFSDEPWKSYALVKLQLTFQPSKNGNFCILMIFLSHACGIMIKTWSNDDCGFKIRCWPKFLTFDYQMTILPLQLTVEQLGFLTVQFDAVSLETWHMDAWQCIWAHGTWLDPWKPQFLCKNQNPNFDCVRRQLDCGILERFWSLILPNLEEYGRANFGVQQLPCSIFLDLRM